MNTQAAEANPRARIIVALDLPARDAGVALVHALSPHPGLFKIGLQLYTAAGPEIVRAVRDLGGRVFLDLKLHDIPNTAAGAVESACSLGVEMFTLHLSGGRAMIEVAVRAAPPNMLLLGVTVLTTATEETLREVGVDSPMEEQVLRLAQLAAESGLGGIVASARELQPLRRAHGPKLKIITPGIRPPGSPMNDQRRTMTPAEAFKAGADYLVIGRPITAARDPREALEQIIADAV